MNCFLQMLLSLSVGGTILTLLLLFLRRVLGSRLPSAFYYYAWLVVLLRFLLPLPGLLPSPADRAAYAPAAAPTLSVDRDTAPIRPWQADTGMPDAPFAQETITPAPAGHQAESSGRYRLDAAALLRTAGELLREPGFWLRLWGLGVLGSGAYYLLGYLGFRRGLRKRLRPALPSDLAVYDSLAPRRKPRLCRSGAVTTPMLVGLLRPRLILPDRTYSPEMLRGILRHELTHYQRGDVAYKWFAVLVTVIHWFNPITRLFRTEMDRACELACDEALLRHMDVNEKRFYGELLLDLAADRALPRSVVATSFAIEKRNLKERLVQIMTYKKRGRASFALLLAVLLLLTGCAGALGPNGGTPAAPTVTPEPAAENAVPTPMPTTEMTRPPETSDETVEYANSVTVTTVDEFLAAIAPDTQILLEPGTYDLSTAKNYGQPQAEGYYTWEEVYDGYQLVIRDVDALAILGGGTEDVTIAAIPRYANVLAFRGCANPLVMKLTAGHTQEPGYCAGGVLAFESCAAPYVLDCSLYGCGTLGVDAQNCRKATVRDTEIYECSLGAVWASNSYDVLVDSCSIHDCGRKGEDGFNCYNLFMANSCTGFTVLNSDVTHNDAQYLLDTRYSQEVNFLGCGFENNRVTVAAFSIQGTPPVVDGCAFTGNNVESYYPDTYTGYAVDSNGEDLISFDLDRMQRKEAVYDGPTADAPADLSGTTAEDGITTEYHVSTVDEFLAAIGPDTTIYLDAEQLDLSTASSYGGYGSQYFYWETQFDGPSLVIAGVANLRIVGQGKDKTEILAIPRYADVLHFVHCENVAVESLTAGHTETGECAGDVLRFEDVTNVSVKDCGLFGCGVWGIRAENCWNVAVTDTEIYSCSSGAFIMFQCTDVIMTGLDIHDMPSPETAFIADCENFLYEGKLMGSGSHKL